MCDRVGSVNESTPMIFPYVFGDKVINQPKSGLGVYRAPLKNKDSRHFCRWEEEFIPNKTRQPNDHGTRFSPVVHQLPGQRCDFIRCCSEREGGLKHSLQDSIWVSTYPKIGVGMVVKPPQIPKSSIEK